MPLLLVPLAVLVLVALWLVLLPLSLWARYRTGRARRRPQAWVVRANAWLLAASVPLFLGTSWLATRWVEAALRDAAIGLLLGIASGIVALWLARFERDARGLVVVPNRWPVLLLTALVALRILAGAWLAWRGAVHAGSDPALAWLDGGAWSAIAGLFLGHALAWTWGLRARLARA